MKNSAIAIIALVSMASPAIASNEMTPTPSLRQIVDQIAAEGSAIVHVDANRTVRLVRDQSQCASIDCGAVPMKAGSPFLSRGRELWNSAISPAQGPALAVARRRVEAMAMIPNAPHFRTLRVMLNPPSRMWADRRIDSA